MSLELFGDLTRELTSFPAYLTAKVGLACLGLHILVSLPLACYLSGPKNSCRRILGFVVTAPLVFPPIALGFILLTLLGQKGPLGSLLDSYFGIRLVFSQAGVILAGYIAGLPLFVRPLEAALRRTEIKNLAQAARTLGLGPVKTFLLVCAPQAGAVFASGLCLALARGLGEVGVTMMLGGNIVGRSNTLSLEIYNAVAHAEFDRAMALCFILAFGGLIFYLVFEKFTPHGD
ncbi:MAG: ABC transporter permease subunit [Deltaproteobacteria bacterium]|nr:ABC transporter permease subunit [Deltaproteobacteria bacterium]